MAFTIDDIMKSLSSYTGLGNSSDSGAQTFAAQGNSWSPNQSNAGTTFGADAGNQLTRGNPAITGSNSGFGLNVGTGQLALGGLQSLAGIFNAMQANKLANQQFKLTKDVTNTNLNNSIQSYNTALSDRANSRYYTQGQSQADADAYIASNRLSR